MAQSRILVVDDDRDAADMLAELLEVQGYAVTVAYEGQSAVEAAERVHPDVVLCDVALPTMDGFEVARALRASEAARDALLVALTGYGGSDHAQRAQEAGFDAHLTKPLDMQALQRILESETAQDGEPAR